MTLDADGDVVGEAALRYAWHGWPIMPGTWPVNRRAHDWPTPLAQALPYRGPMSTNDVVRSWHHHDHPVLLATGLTIDVIAARQPLGTALQQRVERHGPVAVLPNGHWLFFVEAGQPPSDELLRRKVHYHGTGSWVPLPPTHIGQHQLTWHVDPASTGWRLFQRGAFDSAPCPPQPPRRPPAQHHTPPSKPLITLRLSPPPDRSRSHAPRPRHHTLHVASDRAIFEVTHLHQEPT